MSINSFNYSFNLFCFFYFYFITQGEAYVNTWVIIIFFIAGAIVVLISIIYLKEQSEV
ncbi:hypothetical protein EV195_101176 [Tenacibaculum skagerrakense]|uniref:Uncharacterized protein n=1 Tax=Tenacibaculum skagerrakense TaxID=186571 RepID=A0A4R2P0K9_9FLAO|nr:hypothetical protein EV195_101176 [Tenacibaculum skagerrakense]